MSQQFVIAAHAPPLYFRDDCNLHGARLLIVTWWLVELPGLRVARPYVTMTQASGPRPQAPGASPRTWRLVRFRGRWPLPARRLRRRLGHRRARYRISDIADTARTTNWRAVMLRGRGAMCRATMTTSLLTLQGGSVISFLRSLHWDGVRLLLLLVAMAVPFQSIAGQKPTGQKPTGQKPTTQRPAPPPPAAEPNAMPRLKRSSPRGRATSME